MQSNPLLPVVRPLPESLRHALGEAVDSDEPLRRNTWRGCALSQAATCVGRRASSVRQVTRTFGVQRVAVMNFVGTWDRLQGSDEECTEVLREALVLVDVELAATAPEPAVAPADLVDA